LKSQVTAAVVAVSAKDSGWVSVAGLVCLRPSGWLTEVRHLSHRSPVPCSHPRPASVKMPR